MERLTKRIADHVDYTKGQYEETIPAECNASDIRTILQRLAAYEDTGMEPQEIKDFVSRWKEATGLAGLCKEAGIDRLRVLAEADKDGRCVVLPCKVGDTVWTNFSIQGSYLRKTDRPYECRVLFVGLNESDSGGYINFPASFGQIGKTVFLTREAAEKALEATK